MTTLIELVGDPSTTSGLPDWVQIIGFFVVTTMGAGFGAPLITQWLNRKKLSADSAAVDASAGLTSVQTAEHVVNMVQKQLDAATARIEALEASNQRLEASNQRLQDANQRLENEMHSLRESTRQETETLRQQLQEAQNSNALLFRFIGEVERKWSTITQEPFPDYETLRRTQ